MHHCQSSRIILVTWLPYAGIDRPTSRFQVCRNVSVDAEVFSYNEPRTFKTSGITNNERLMTKMYIMTDRRIRIQIKHNSRCSNNNTDPAHSSRFLGN